MKKKLVILFIITFILLNVGPVILVKVVGFDTLLKNPELIFTVTGPVLFIYIISSIIMRMPKKREIEKQKIDPESISSEFETRYQYLYENKLKNLERKRKLIVFLRILEAITVVIFATGKVSLLLVLIALLYIDLRLVKGFRKDYKNDIISSFINLINPNLRYDPNVEIEVVSAEYRKAGFDNKKFNKVYADDNIEGFIDNSTFIKMCEFEAEFRIVTETDIKIDKGLQSILKKDKFTHTHIHEDEQIFRGIFAQSECEANVEPCVRILKNKTKIPNENRVELDSTEFEKYFDVYSDNKIVAIQVLTSDVMMMLLDFYNKHKIDYEILLRNRKIYIRFWVGPMFEPAIFKSSMNKKILLQYFGILKFVLDVTKGINKNLKNI